MRRILVPLALAAAAASAQPADAQSFAVSVMHAENRASGGWDRGEAVRVNSVRVEVPIGRVVPFVGAGTAEINNYACGMGHCVADGTPYVVAAGASYRFGRDRALGLVPYVSAGAEATLWTEGGNQYLPLLNAGVDLFPVRNAALRLEYQAWSHQGGNLGLGLRVSAP